MLKIYILIIRFLNLFNANSENWVLRQYNTSGLFSLDFDHSCIKTGKINESRVEEKFKVNPLCKKLHLIMLITIQ